MTTVGIKEFKAHLSQYVRRAASGESIAIADRGVAVAILSSIPPEIKAANELVGAGLAHWSGKKLSPQLLSRLPKRRFKKAPGLSDMVIKEREEGW